MLLCSALLALLFVVLSGLDTLSANESIQLEHTLD